MNILNIWQHDTTYMLIGAALVILGFIFWYIMFDADHPWAVWGQVAVFIGFLAIMVGVTLHIITHSEKLRQTVVSAITDQYEITNIEPISRPPANWCSPLNSDSMEMSGFAKGQEIHFRVGLSKCDTDHPVANIIITQTPGQTLSPDELERGTKLKEKP